jgi:hypothetical protein
MKLTMLLALGLSVAQAAEPTGTLTLACQGKTTDKTHVGKVAEPEPVSLGLMIDFTSNAVSGFEFPGSSGAQVKIVFIDKTTIGFSGTSAMGGTAFGRIDRITGDVEAATEFWSHETDPHKLVWATAYALKCKPTQRMF